MTEEPGQCRPAPQQGRAMKALHRTALLLLFTLAPGACVATTTSSTMWTASAGPEGYARPGRVEWIREVVQREEGDPAGGALAGALIGGVLGGRGPRAPIRAVRGAALGAAPGPGPPRSRPPHGTRPFCHRGS